MIPINVDITCCLILGCSKEFLASIWAGGRRWFRRSALQFSSGFVLGLNGRSASGSQRLWQPVSISFWRRSDSFCTQNSLSLPASGLRPMGTCSAGCRSEVGIVFDAIGLQIEETVDAIKRAACSCSPSSTGSLYLDQSVLRATKPTRRWG